MKAIVVEDSRLAREGLVRMLKDFPQLTVVGQADHPSTAFTLVNEEHPDVIFLDIHMPGGTGFELLERLDYLPRIIFTTAYSDYAIRSFDFNTVDYLLKPISKERLSQAIHKLFNQTENMESAQSTEATETTEADGSSSSSSSSTPTSTENNANKAPLESNSKIFVKDGEKCFLIRLESIRYIESQKNYVQLFFEDKKAYVKKSLNSVEERLPRNMFFRASRQHIVNLQEIQSIEESMSDGYKIIMSDGKVLEISRRNAIELKDLLSL
jgi:two-component system LytT family response regulator